MSAFEWFELIRNVALTIAAVVGIYLAWNRVSAANRQAEASISQATLAQRAHVSEIFNSAIGKLSNKKLEVRLGAIYTLYQLAEDFPELAQPVYRLLQTYLQENDADYGDQEMPADVSEITQMVTRWLNIRG